MNTTGNMTEGQDNITSPAWDTGKAWEEYQIARAAGDTDAELLAMRRWGEAQTNASIGLVGQVVRPLAEQIKAAGESIGAASALQEQRFDWILDQFKVFLSKEDTRHGTYDKELFNQGSKIDAILLAVQDGAALLGKVLPRIEAVEAGVGKLTVRVDTLETHGVPAEAVSEVHQVSQRVARLEIWVALLALAMTANAIIYIVAISFGGGR